MSALGPTEASCVVMGGGEVVSNRMKLSREESKDEGAEASTYITRFMLSHVHKKTKGDIAQTRRNTSPNIIAETLINENNNSETQRKY